MKKPNSKYNEEISSESETERFVSGAVLGWIQQSTTLILAIYICFFYSNVEPKKRHPIEEQENEETPQEKKLRLAKLYIDQLKEEGEFLLYT